MATKLRSGYPQKIDLAGSCGIIYKSPDYPGKKDMNWAPGYHRFGMRATSVSAQAYSQQNDDRWFGDWYWCRGSASTVADIDYR